jgi:hypothetical protein
MRMGLAVLLPADIYQYLSDAFPFDSKRVGRFTEGMLQIRCAESQSVNWLEDCIRYGVGVER